MARSALLICLLALGSLVQAQELPRLTMEIRGERMERALPRIARALGVSLTISPEFLSEVVVVRWRDLPGQTALDSLARNLGGEWQVTPQDRRLTRTAALRAAQAESERPHLLKALAKSMESLGKPPAWMPEGIADFQPPEQPRGDTERAKQIRETYLELEKLRNEMSRAFWKVLTPESVANIRLEERVVHSTQPTSGQVAFPSEVRTAFEEFQRKQAALSARVRTLRGPGMADDPDVGIEQLTARVLMIVERQTPLTWSVEIDYLNAANMPTQSTSDRLSGFGADAETLVMMGRAPEQVELPYKLNDPKREIPIIEAMKPLSIMMNAITQGAPPPAMQGDVFALFRKPDENDPLSFTASSVMFTLADDQKANLTAVLPDEMFVMESGAFMSRALNLQAACELMESLGLTQVEIKDGLVEVRPRFLSLNFRLDRKAVRQAIDAETAQGSLTLDQKAALSATKPDQAETLFAMYQFIALPSMTDGLFFGGFGGEDNSMEVLRFYHSLSAEQRRVLVAGEPLHFRGLTSEQRRLFVLCIKDISNVTVRERTLEDMMTRIMIDELLEPSALAVGRPFADISDRPTALPIGGFVRAQVQRETVVKPVATGNTLFPGQIMTASAYGFMKQLMEQPEAQAFAGMMPRMDRLRLGERTTLSLEFHVMDNFGARGAASGARFTGDPAGVPESALPQDFLERARKMREAMERTESEIEITPDGVPPPPPPGSRP